MVDAIDSKSVIRKGVRVQVPSPVNETGQVKACPVLRLHGSGRDLKLCGRRTVRLFEAKPA